MKRLHHVKVDVDATTTTIYISCARLAMPTAREYFVYGDSTVIEQAAALAGMPIAHAMRRRIVPPHHVTDVIRARELGLSRFTQCDMRGVASVLLPVAPLLKNLSRGPRERQYNVKYGASGNILVTSTQSGVLRVYGAAAGSKYPLIATHHARDVAWAVSSVDIAPDEKNLLYSTMDSNLHSLKVGASACGQAHTVIPLGEDSSYRFPVYQACYSPDGSEVVAACGDNKLRVYDLAIGRVTERVDAHDHDINAVAFAETLGFGSSVLISGSDDALIKVWDRRMPSEPAGYLPGHTEGIVSLEPRGDGVYVLSNGKDQTARLWDLRRTHTGQDFSRLRPRPAPHTGYDYRFTPYPVGDSHARVAGDMSVLTYRGHSVLQTLIRARFSADASTGGRYVVTGSADGGIYIYEALIGEVSAILRGHSGVVRDVAWHPRRLDAHLASASFDGTVAVWAYDGDAASNEQSRRRIRARQCAAVRGAARTRLRWRRVISTAEIRTRGQIEADGGLGGGSPIAAVYDDDDDDDGEPEFEDDDEADDDVDVEEEDVEGSESDQAASGIASGGRDIELISEPQTLGTGTQVELQHMSRRLLVELRSLLRLQGVQTEAESDDA